MTERRTYASIEAIGRIDVFGHSFMAEAGATSIDFASMHKIAQCFPARFRNCAWGGSVAMIPGIPTTAQNGVGNIRAGWGHLMYKNPNHERTCAYTNTGVALNGGNTTINASVAAQTTSATAITVLDTSGFYVNQPVILRQAGGSQLDEINYIGYITDGTHLGLWRPTANAYSVGDALTSCPDFYSAPRQLAIMEYDYHDIYWMGPTIFTRCFPEVYRAMIAKLREGAFFGIDSKLIRRISGTWTAGNVADGYGMGSSPLVATSVSRELTATAAATLAIDIPSNFEGQPGAVILWFKTKATGDGAKWTWNVDGGTNFTKETRNLNGFFYNNNTGTRAANGVEMPSCVVIRGLAAGKHTINLSVAATSDIAGTATFLGFGIIDSEPPPIIISLPNRVTNYTQFWAAPGYVPNDSDIPTMNAAIMSVVNEFTPTDQVMLVLDRDPILNRTSWYFASDGDHNNDAGHFLLAAAYMNLINNATIPMRNLIKCSPTTQRGWYPVGATGDAGGFAVNFKTNWSNYPGGNPTEWYKDIATGRVDVHGEIYHTTNTDAANSVIFNLPKGHRPAVEQQFLVVCAGGSMPILVRANGDVVVGGLETRTSISSVSYISLSLSFYAEQ